MNSDQKRRRAALSASLNLQKHSAAPYVADSVGLFTPKNNQLQLLVTLQKVNS